MGSPRVDASRARIAGFADDRVADDLARHGYAVVPLLRPDELARVRALRGRLGPAPSDPRDGFFLDAWCDDREYRRSVDLELRAILEAPLRRLAPGHDVLGVAHLAKWPTACSTVSTHRDPCFVDESRARSFTAWCALDATEASNGLLLVAPGSHRDAGPGWRVHDGAENLVPEVDAAPERFLVEVPLSPGHAVVFDHALVHGSGPNTSPTVRVAVAATLVPSGVQPAYALAAGPETAEVFDVDRRFFATHQFHALDGDRMRAELPAPRRAPRATRAVPQPRR